MKKKKRLTMTTSHATIVVGDCYQVVDCIAVILVDNIRRHIQALDGKLDVRVQLVSQVSVVAESLQTDDEKGREGPDIKFLCSLLVLLAAWTIPAKFVGDYNENIISRESFLTMRRSLQASL